MSCIANDHSTIMAQRKSGELACPTMPVAFSSGRWTKERPHCGAFLATQAGTTATCSERPETWVTERTGHIGNTFRQRLGGVDAVEGMFGYGRAPTVRVSPARGRGHDGRVPGVRYLAQDRLQNLSALSEAWPGGAE